MHGIGSEGQAAQLPLIDLVLSSEPKAIPTVRKKSWDLQAGDKRWRQGQSQEVAAVTHSQ